MWRNRKHGIKPLAHVDVFMHMSTRGLPGEPVSVHDHSHCELLNPTRRGRDNQLFCEVVPEPTLEPRDFTSGGSSESGEVDEWAAFAAQIDRELEQ